MTYGHDISKMTLDDLASIIKTSYLIPSMRILLDGMDEQFKILERKGLPL